MKIDHLFFNFAFQIIGKCEAMACNNSIGASIRPDDDQDIPSQMLSGGSPSAESEPNDVPERSSSPEGGPIPQRSTSADCEPIELSDESDPNDIPKRSPSAGDELIDLPQRSVSAACQPTELSDEEGDSVMHSGESDSESSKNLEEGDSQISQHDTDSDMTGIVAGKAPYKTCVTRKKTLRSLSLSYPKKDGRAWPRPSFFSLPSHDSSKMATFVVFLCNSQFTMVKFCKFW